MRLITCCAVVAAILLSSAAAQEDRAFMRVTAPTRATPAASPNQGQIDIAVSGGSWRAPANISVPVTITGGEGGYTVTDDSPHLNFVAGDVEGRGTLEGFLPATGSVTLTATDDGGKTSTKSVTFNVLPLLGASYSDLNTEAGQVTSLIPETAGLLGTGTWTYTAGSAQLPDGLNFNPTTGAITGNPVEVGTVAGISLSVEDSIDGAKAATPLFSVTITAPATSIDFSIPAIADATPGSLITSAAVTPNGLSTAASITAEESIISVAGSAWAKTSTISPGESFSVRVGAPPAGQTISPTVTIGDVSRTWSVTSKSNTVVSLSSASRGVSIASLFGSSWGADTTKRAILPRGVHIGSGTASTPALVADAGMGGTLSIEIEVGASVQGAGGEPNSGTGGTAIQIDSENVSIVNNGDILAGGGGGGAGGVGGEGTAPKTVRTPASGTDYSYAGNDQNPGNSSYWVISDKDGYAAIYVSGWWVGDYPVDATTAVDEALPRSTYYLGTLQRSEGGVRYYSYHKTSEVGGTMPTNGGSGGNGGLGRGYNNSPEPGTVGQAGGENAGNGGLGGWGGNAGGNGEAGQNGSDGNAGEGQPGAAGGLAGYAIFGSPASYSGSGAKLGR